MHGRQLTNVAQSSEKQLQGFGANLMDQIAAITKKHQSGGEQLLWLRVKMRRWRLRRKCGAGQEGATKGKVNVCSSHDGAKIGGLPDLQGLHGQLLQLYRD